MMMVMMQCLLYCPDKKRVVTNPAVFLSLQLAVQKKPHSPEGGGSLQTMMLPKL